MSLKITCSEYNFLNDFAVVLLHFLIFSQSVITVILVPALHVVKAVI